MPHMMKRRPGRPTILSRPSTVYRGYGAESVAAGNRGYGAGFKKGRRKKGRKKGRKKARGGFLPNIPGVNWTDTFSLNEAGVFGSVMGHFLKGR